MMRLFRSKKKEDKDRSMSALDTLMAETPPYTIDSEGNTPLHLAAKSLQYEESLETIFETYSESDIADMATTINLNNKLPFDLVNTPKNTKQLQLKKILKHYTVKLSTTPMDEPLSIDEILNSYYQSGNSTLTLHLNIACEIANEVRSIITESSNHPVQTFGKNAEKSHDKILLMRSLYSPEHPSLDPLTPTHQTLNDVLAVGLLIESLNRGNCYETSMLTLKKLHENKKYLLTGELAYLKNSDHMVAVIGRDQNSDPSDYRTWGKTAVICDGWLGKVYPTAYIPRELKGSKRYNFVSSNTGYTVIINFNPDIHELHITSDPIQSSFKSKPLFHFFHSTQHEAPVAPTSNTHHPLI